MAKKMACRCGNSIDVEPNAKRVTCSQCHQVYEVQRRESQPKPETQQPVAQLTTPQELAASTPTNAQELTSSNRNTLVSLTCSCGRVLELPSQGALIDCPSCHAVIRLLGKDDLSESDEELKLEKLVETPRVDHEEPVEPLSPPSPSLAQHRPKPMTLARLLVAPKSLPSRRTVLGASVGAVITTLILSVVVMYGRRWLRGRKESTIRSIDPGVEVEIAAYPRGPRLPSTLTRLPKDYLSDRGDLIDKAFDLAEEKLNAAPACLAALCEIDPELNEAVIDEFETLTVDSDSATECRNSINAWWNQFVGRSRTIPERDLLEAYDPLIEKFFVAQRRPEFSLMLGVGPHESLAQLPALQNLVRLLILRIRSLASHRSIDESIRELEIALRALQDFGKGPALCGEVCTELECELWRFAFPALLQDRRLTIDQITQLEKLVLQHDAIVAVSRIPKHLAAEQFGFERLVRQTLWPEAMTETELRTALAAILEGAALGERHHASDTYLNSSATKQLVVSLRAANAGDLQAAVEEWDSLLNDCYRELLTADQPSLQVHRRLQLTWESHRKSIKDELEKNGGINPRNIGLYLAELTLVPCHNLYRSYLTAIAFRRVALAQSMVRHDQMTTEFTPESMREKIARQTRLTDPFSGNPLQFISIESRWIVYSFGPDRVDGQAKVAWRSNTEDVGDLFLDLS